MNPTKRLFRALGILLFTILGTASGFSQQAPVRIYPLGDSLTEGFSNGAGVQGAYRNRLYTLLGTAGYNVNYVGTNNDTNNPTLPDINHQGHGGYRIDQIQSNLATWLSQIEDPDVILLLIGTNDFYQNFNLGSVQTRMANLLTDITTRRPFAKVIVGTLPLRTDNATMESQQVAFNLAIPGMVAQQVALGRQVSFVDLHAALSPADLTADGVHPTATGYEKIANMWYPAIASVISPQGTSNPPVIARIGSLVNLTSVPVVFSKPVSDSSVNLANFSIPGLTISGAVLDAATKRTITLTTSSQSPGIIYNLSVSGVTDRTGQQTMIAPQSMVNFSSNAITNGSFESDFAGWTVSGNREIKSSAPYVPTNGSKLVAFNTGESAPNGSLSQSFTTVVGQPYQLAFDAGVFGYTTNPQRLQVAVQGAGSLVAVTETMNGLGGGSTSWFRKTYNFVATSTTTTLTLTDVSASGSSIDMVLDNVSVGAQPARMLSVTSAPANAANMTIIPNDLAGNGNGSTGLIRLYNDGASVTVTAPPANGGNNFLRWQKNGTDLPGSTPAITITMDASHALTAVYGSNSAPVAAPDAYAASAGTQLVVPAIGVLTNDIDADGSPLTAILNAPPLSGSLILNPNGSFTYNPNPGFTGSDSFTYRAYDGVSNSNVVTVSLTVSASTTQLIVNGSFESNLSSWTTSGNMVVQSASPYIPSNGSKLLAFNAGNLPANGVISQTFPTVSGQTYQLAFDVAALAYNTNSQRIQVQVVGSGSLINQTITINGLGNGATPWSPRTFSFVANSPTTTLSFTDTSTTSNIIDLLLDNVRVTGSTPNYTLTVNSMPASGIAVGISPPDRNSNASGTTNFTRSYASGAIVNLSAPAFSGATGFLKWQKNGTDFAVTPGTSVTIDADMTLTAVYGTNTAPVAVGENYTTQADTVLNVASPGVLGNDTDPESNPLTAVVDVSPLHGNLALSPNGGFVYTPTGGYTGPDSFTYHANDGSLDSNIVTVNLSVTGVLPSSLANGSFESDEANWTITGNRIVISTTGGYVPSDLNKLMVMNGGDFVPDAVISQAFATTPGQSYVLSFDVGAIGINTNEQLLGVNVTGATTFVPQTESVFANGLNTSVWASKNYVFTASGTAATLVFSDLSTTSAGIDLLLDNVRLAEACALTVASSPANGLSVTVSPSDADGNSSGTTQFVRTYGSGTTVNLTAPAIDGASSFVKWQKNNIDFSNTAATSVTVDANMTMTAIYAVNTAPVASSESYSANFQTQLIVAGPGVLGNDTDGENNPLTAVIDVPPAGAASFSLNSNGGFSYTPANGFSGPDSFTYHANDGALNSNVVTVTINVAPANLIVNGGFENDETGWTNTGNRIVIPATPPYQPSELLKFMVMNGGDTQPSAVISQTFATTPGQAYVLNFDLGILALNTATQTLSISLTGNSTLFSTSETLTGNGSGNSVWTPKTYSFTADSATTTLSFTDNSTSSSLIDLMLDNVRVNAGPGGGLGRVLTVNSAPTSGLIVTVSPNDLNNNSNGSTQLTRVYADSTTVNLSAPATLSGANFIKWTKNGADFAATQNTSVVMDANHTMAAVYDNLAAGPFTNGSFESGFAGWTNTPNVFIESAAPYVPTQGSKLASFNGGDTAPNGVISQTFSTTPGSTYTLAFDVGAFAFNTSPQRLQVTVNGAGSLLSQSITVNGLGNGSTNWSPQSFTFLANTSASTLTFTDISASTLLLDLVLDNVRITELGGNSTLTVTSTPSTGVGITVSPADINTNGNGTTQFIRTYTNGTVVNLTAPATSGTDVFVKWRKNNVDFSNNLSTSVTMDASHTMTAVYQAPAVPGSLANGGFEQGETGWIITGNRLIIPATGPYLPNEGLNLAVLNGGETTPNAVLSQTIPTTPGQTYLLQFDVGILAVNNDTQVLNVAATGNATLLSATETLTGNGLGDSVWTTRSYAFIADSANTTLTFTDSSATTIGVDLLLDNVRLNTGTARSLTVNSSPNNGASITVSPIDMNNRGDGATPLLRTYADATVVSLTAPASFGTDNFVKWQRNGVDFSNSATTSVTMDAAYTLTAVYGSVVIEPGTLVNGSFESGFTGWANSGNVLIQSSSPYAPTNGTKLAAFNGGNLPPNGVLSQTFATTPGISYTLAFDAGVLAYNTSPQSVKVDLTGSGSLLSQTITINGINGGATKWVAQSFAFTANSATTTLSFTDVSTTSNLLDLVIDKVSVSLTNPGATTTTLTVNSTPANGATITVSPADNSSNGNGTTQFTRTYNSGTVVTLTAPATFGGNNFSKWQKNSVDLSMNATTTVTMDASHTLTAVYSAAPPVGSFVNGNFESALSGWTTAGSANTVVVGGVSGSNSTNVLKFNSGDSPNNGVLSQSFATTPGTLYTVTFEMGVLAYNTSAQVIRVAATGTGSLLSQAFTMNGTGGGAVIWSNKTVTFTADSASTTLTFSDQSTTGFIIDLLLDNVTVTGAGSPGTVDLTVNSTPANGAAITVSPADNNSNANGTTQFVRTYNTGTVVTLTAPATFGGDNFVKWQKNGVDAAVTATTTVTTDANYTMTAVYQASGGGPSLLVNGSFESGLSGWTNTGNLQIQSTAPYTATDGTKIVGFNGSDATPNGVVSQSFATVPGTTYTLAFDAGVLSYNTASQTMQVGVIGTGSLLSQTVTVTRTGGSNNLWLPQSFTFVANSATSTLSFTDTSASTSGLDLVLDNVRVTVNNAVPLLKTLTIASTPVTAAITVSPSDSLGNGSGTTNFGRAYTTGTVVNLTAPATTGGVGFLKWQKNGVDLTTNNSTSVTMDANYTLTAVYSQPPFSNGSFETGTFTPWTISGGTVDSVKINSSIGGTDGSKIVEFNSANSPAGGILTQTFTTTPGVTYNLAFDLGVLAYNTSLQTVLVTVTGSSNLLSQTASINGINGGTVKWEAKAFSFTANTTATTLTFTDTSAATGSIDMLLDNVRVTNANARNLTIKSVVANAVEISVSPADNNGNTNGTTQFTRTFNLTTSVSLTAPGISASGATFVKWVKDGADFAVTPAVNLTISADTTMVAVYAGGSNPPLGSNLLKNGSFEQLYPEFEFWFHSGATRIEQPTEAAYPTFRTDGNNTLSFNVDGANDGVVSQSFATTPGTTYTLRFDQGSLGYVANPQTLRTTVTGSSTLLDVYDTVICRADFVFVWVPRSYTFTANSTTTTLTLADASSTGNALDMYIDNVRIQAGVQAPSTLTVNTTPTSGKVITVSPVDLAGQGNGTSSFTRNFNTGSSVQLVAPFANFVKWLKNGAWYATNPTISVLMDGNHTMTAVYTTTPVVGPFANGSFESEFTGWTWSGSQQSVKVKDGLPSTDGLYVIEFNSNDSATDGSISQTFNTTPGSVYTVTFDMGTKAFTFSQQSLRCQVTGTGTLASQVFSINGIGGGQVIYAPKTLTFTANSATSTLTFSDQSTITLGLDLLLDNVKINGFGGVGGPTNTLTVNSTPSNGALITVSPADNNSSGNGTTAFTRTYNSGTAITLTAPATFGGNSFSKWRKNNVDVTTNNTTTFTLTADDTFTAVYVTPPLASFLNGNFEAGLNSWTSSGSPNTVRTEIGLSGTNATRVVAFNGGDSPNDGVLNQTFATTPGTNYTVNFDMGVLAYTTNPQVIQISATGSGSLLSQNFSMNGAGGGAVTWSTKTVNFTANSATTTLTFRDQSTTSFIIDLLLDNVVVTPTAPAPSLPPPPTGETEEFAPAATVAPPSNTAVPDGSLGAMTLSGTPGAFRITMNATEAGHYVLERSDNLSTWKFHSDIQLEEPGLLEFEDNTAPEPRMFYRIGKQLEEINN